mmetsp:Transcript_25528/g.51196  ORF Transcript_25528/g.51196 Transcript_25528/m.51196 type:complete len:81 (+) Transcript_25528:181-423(+)
MKAVNAPTFQLHDLITNIGLTDGSFNYPPTPPSICVCCEISNQRSLPPLSALESSSAAAAASEWATRERCSIVRCPWKTR